MNVWKKIGALTFVLIVAMALSVSAFAASVGSTGNTGVLASQETSVTFTNTIKAFNPDETSIYAPDVTYAFSIEAATEATDGVGVAVTDTNSVTAYVLAGNWSGANSEGTTIQVSGTPTITPAKGTYAMTTDTLTAAAAGNENAENVTVSFTGVSFPKTGIYRYKITRTVTDTNGVLTQDSSNNRYLDVYVKDNAGTMEIYGYVLHNSTEAITTVTAKSAGFVDEYHTSNLIVSKTLVNDTAMNTHQFPFSVSISAKGAHITERVLTDTTYTGSAATVGAASGTITTGTAYVSTPTIGHQSAVKFVGIPNGFTASVYETNDVTGTTYNSAGAADTAAVSKTISWESTGDANKSNTASTTAATDETKTVEFTNTLVNISPTGVTLRYAPYFLTLGAGVVALPLTRSYRRREED